MDRYYIAFFTALAISYFATPFAKKWAEKVGAIDVPKDERRVHKVPIPRLGGLAIFLACVISIMVFVKLTPQVISVLIGALIIVTAGYFDDIKPLSAKIKFAIQIIAALIVISSGISIERFTNPLFFLNERRWIELGILSYPVTLLWIVGVTNAINLIDGLDGLAAGVSSISSVTLFVVAVSTGQMGIAMITAILAGATIGFLPYNFNPAKIFMGDSGALFLGYMLSVISIMGVLKSATALSIVVPIFAMGLPIFDTLFAMLRRFVNGKSMVEADKGHLHHRLLDIGFSQKQAVLTLYSISAVLGFSAIVVVEAKFKVALAMVFAVFFLVSIGAKHLGLMQIKEGNNKIDA